ncbi:universal stress protein [Chromatiales bacterium (ex Bugula neritina AB1)]|nr:universal stress protein [Chromatiales bacterium (ex Bugula neritina AB1)]
MPNKIMVAVDGSDGAQRTVKIAAAHATLANAELILTYVIDWSPYSFHTPEELEDRHRRRESEIQRANDSMLSPHVDALQDSGLTLSTVVRHGKIAETLDELVKEYNITQVYVGRIGESKLRSMIFGSVTAALVQSSTVPVTVVP